jgi:hypothetical protein
VDKKGGRIFLVGTMKKDRDLEKLANDHAEWYGKKSTYDFRQGFIHGYKHGKEDLESMNNREK